MIGSVFSSKNSLETFSMEGAFISNVTFHSRDSLFFLGVLDTVYVTVV